MTHSQKPEDIIPINRALNFTPVINSSTHQGYRIEPDNSLTIQFKSGGIYNYPEIAGEERDEYVRRAPSEKESNGGYFNGHIRHQKFTKLDK